MDLWLVLIITATIAYLLKSVISSNSISESKKWPPGPKTVPIITLIIWFRRSFVESQAALRALNSKFGPIVTLSTSSARPVIFIFSRALAYQALVQKGALFAERPKPLLIAEILSSYQHTVTFAGYGPLWRVLRRNFTYQTLNSSRVKDCSLARKWVLDSLLNHLQVSSVGGDSEAGGKNSVAVKVMDHFRFAMFQLLLIMCFGEKLEETKIKEIEAILQELLASLFSRFRVLNLRQVWLTKILFRGRWNEFYSLKKKQEDILIPLIRARKQYHQKTTGKTDDKNGQTMLSTCYLDTLLKLEIPDSTTEGQTRMLTEQELVSLCFEFLNAGTDTTSTTLQWIIANLVKNQTIQAKVFEEIESVIGENSEVSEDELCQMPYLKAVILEGLRRHPPGHYLLPHGVTREGELGGYIIPKNASLNFVVAEMGRDSEVWDDPLLFKPERFMGRLMDHEEFDRGEMKMMPFGAGRRMCPGRELAMLHLLYFVANLVWNFEWTAVEGDEVDLSEKQEFTVVMKYPLHARISPRKN